jgi:hypothetical protein
LAGSTSEVRLEAHNLRPLSGSDEALPPAERWTSAWRLDSVRTLRFPLYGQKTAPGPVRLTARTLDGQPQKPLRWRFVDTRGHKLLDGLLPVDDQYDPLAAVRSAGTATDVGAATRIFLVPIAHAAHRGARRRRGHGSVGQLEAAEAPTSSVFVAKVDRGAPTRRVGSAITLTTGDTKQQPTAAVAAGPMRILHTHIQRCDCTAQTPTSAAVTASPMPASCVRFIRNQCLTKRELLIADPSRRQVRGGIEIPDEPDFVAICYRIAPALLLNQTGPAVTAVPSGIAPPAMTAA